MSKVYVLGDKGEHVYGVYTSLEELQNYVIEHTKDTYDVKEIMFGYYRLFDDWSPKFAEFDFIVMQYDYLEFSVIDKEDGDNLMSFSIEVHELNTKMRL